MTLKISIFLGNFTKISQISVGLGLFKNNELWNYYLSILAEVSLLELSNIHLSEHNLKTLPDSDDNKSFGRTTLKVDSNLLRINTLNPLIVL